MASVPSDAWTLVGAGGTPLHSHDYDFNDEILETGVAYYVNLARTALPIGAAT